MKKRLLSILLVCVMLVSLLPTAAFATGETAYTAYTAKIGETNYRFLQDAVNAVKDNETITLLRDCSENPLISRNVIFTLDKGSFTFSGELAKGSNNTDIALSDNVYTVTLTKGSGWTNNNDSNQTTGIKAFIKKAWEKAQTGVFIAGHPITATGWYESDGFPATEETGTVYVDLTNHTVRLKNAKITVSSQPVEVINYTCTQHGGESTNDVKVKNEIPYMGVVCLSDASAYSAGSGSCRLDPFGHYYATRGYKSGYMGTDYFATIGLALLTEDDWSVTVEGANSINVNAAFDHPDSTGSTTNGIKSGDAFGIYAKGALTLSGTGSLTEVVINNGRDSGRNSGNTGGAFDSTAGVYASSLNITSGTYDIATKNTTGKIYTGADANGTPTGETTQTPGNRYGAICSPGNITISGSSTVVEATDALLYGAAIKSSSGFSGGKITISNGAKVTAKEQAVGEIEGYNIANTNAIYAMSGIEIAGQTTVVNVESSFNGIVDYEYGNGVTITDADVTVTVSDKSADYYSDTVETASLSGKTATVNSGKYKKAIPDSYIAEGYYQIYDETDQYYHITNTLPSAWDAACGPTVYSGDGAGDAAIAACDVYDDWSGEYNFYDVYLRQNSSANIENAAVGNVIKVYLAEGVSYTGKVTGTGVKAEETTGEAVTYQGVSFTPHIFTVVVDPETAAAKIVASDGTETYYATMAEAGKNIGADNTLVLLKDATFDYESNYVNFASKSYSIDFNGHKLIDYSLYNFTKDTTVKLSDSSASGAGGFAGTTNITVQYNAIISGGTYDASKITVNGTQATLAITGGFFKNAVNVSSGTLTISGGYYSSDVSSYVKSAYECVALSNESTGADNVAYDAGYRYKVTLITTKPTPTSGPVITVEYDDAKQQTEYHSDTGAALEAAKESTAKATVTVESNTNTSFTTTIDDTVTIIVEDATKVDASVTADPGYQLTKETEVVKDTYTATALKIGYSTTNTEGGKDGSGTTETKQRDTEFVDTGVSATGAVKTAAANVTETNATASGNSIEDVAKAVAATINQGVAAKALNQGTTQKITNSGEGEDETAAKDVSVFVDTYYRTEVKKDETTKSEAEKSFTLDIKPMYQAYATTYTVTADTTLDNLTIGTDTAPIGEPKELDMTNKTVTMRVKLPEGFVESENDTVYVKHTKDDDSVHYYTATVEKEDDDFFAVFTNPHGFSAFEFSRESQAPVYSGGGGGVTTYTVTAESAANGKLTVDKKNASSGSTVTITVKPDADYKLGTLTAKDAKGNAVTLTKSNDTTYTFKMPASKVTISATFVKLGVCPQDATCVYAKFTDADTKEWYHDGVHYCVENGMMNGVSDTQFAPSGTLTRGMVVTVLARLSGATVNATGEEWYADGQKWAMENGISDGTNMTANITREQLATMLYRYAQLKKVDVDAFTKDTNTLSHNDVFTISDWATSGMHFCIAAGIVGGDDHGNLNPLNNATRAEAAAMFQRFCENVMAK